MNHDFLADWGATIMDRRLFLTGIISVASVGWARADDQISLVTPVRRTTIVTADADASIAFYRDLLGMTVLYDREVDNPDLLDLMGTGYTSGRAVALQAQDSMAGTIGLFESLSGKEVEKLGTCSPDIPSGGAAVLFLTTEIDDLFSRIDKAKVQIKTPLKHYIEQGQGVRVFTCFDPNCVTVAIAQPDNPPPQ